MQHDSDVAVHKVAYKDPIGPVNWMIGEKMERNQIGDANERKHYS